MDRDSINSDKIVKDILNKSTVIEPSDNFTSKVMTGVVQLIPDWKKNIQPIISRNAWILIGSFVTLSLTFVILAASFIQGNEASHYKIAQDFDAIIEAIEIFLKLIFSGLKIPALIPIGLFFILFSLFIEPLFKKIFKTGNTE